MVNSPGCWLDSTGSVKFFIRVKTGKSVAEGRGGGGRREGMAALALQTFSKELLTYRKPWWDERPHHSLTDSVTPTVCQALFLA